MSLPENMSAKIESAGHTAKSASPVKMSQGAPILSIQVGQSINQSRPKSTSDDVDSTSDVAMRRDTIHREVATFW